MNTVSYLMISVSYVISKSCAVSSWMFVSHSLFRLHYVRIPLNFWAHRLTWYLTWWLGWVHGMHDILSGVLRDSSPRFVRLTVGRTVGWSVDRSPFYFLAFSSVLSSLLLPKCFSERLHHRPCPPARDFGNRVSGLVSLCNQIQVL